MVRIIYVVSRSGHGMKKSEGSSSDADPRASEEDKKLDHRE
jgi:hypothetical protein